MGKSVKVAISLPEEVLQAAEEERHARGESRSEFIRQAIEALIRQRREREAIEQYVRGYRDYPETANEVAAALQTSVAVLAQEPWE